MIAGNVEIYFRDVEIYWKSGNKSGNFKRSVEI